MELTFEEAACELEKIVNLLEEGKLPLSQAIACFERGQQLVNYCNRLLSQAKGKLSQIKETDDGLKEE